MDDTQWRFWPGTVPRFLGALALLLTIYACILAMPVIHLLEKPAQEEWAGLSPVKGLMCAICKDVREFWIYIRWE